MVEDLPCDRTARLAPPFRWCQAVRVVAELTAALALALAPAGADAPQAASLGLLTLPGSGTGPVVSKTWRIGADFAGSIRSFELRMPIEPQLSRPALLALASVPDARIGAAELTVSQSGDNIDTYVAIPLLSGPCAGTPSGPTPSFGFWLLDGPPGAGRASSRVPRPYLLR
jgi:hypothetical protein